MGLKSMLGSAGLGGGLGLLLGGLPGLAIGAAIGGLSSYNTSQQNKLNRSATLAANQYDYALWRSANDYNSPKRQMERLAEANLNPNLVYGSGNVTGNSATVAGSNGVVPLTAQDYIKNSLGNYQSLLTAHQMEKNIANTAAQTKNADVQRQIMEHNLGYAQDHNIPVGSMPGVDKVYGDILNDVYGEVKEVGGIFKNAWHNARTRYIQSHPDYNGW